MAKSFCLTRERGQFGLQEDAAVDGLPHRGRPFLLILAELYLVPSFVHPLCQEFLARGFELRWVNATGKNVGTQVGEERFFKDDYGAPT